MDTRVMQGKGGMAFPSGPVILAPKSSSSTTGLPSGGAGQSRTGFPGRPARHGQSTPQAPIKPQWIQGATTDTVSKGGTRG